MTWPTSWDSGSMVILYWVLFLAQKIDSHRLSGLSSSHGFTRPSAESWSRTPLRSAYCGHERVYHAVDRGYLIPGYI
ncbi:hypothetical protein AHAS_Ahas07G0124500 [Arachis hypogaea]